MMLVPASIIIKAERAISAHQRNAIRMAFADGPTMARWESAYFNMFGLIGVRCNYVFNWASTHNYMYVLNWASKQQTLSSGFRQSETQTRLLSYRD